MPSGHVWLGDKLQRLAGQGSLYIRPTYESLVARVRNFANVMLSLCLQCQQPKLQECSSFSDNFITCRMIMRPSPAVLACEVMMGV